ncbi:MAG: ABC transporter permease [Pseudomonadota bacterium]|nr:ABC transporter permease [Pseudomonadota bacterium]
MIGFSTLFYKELLRFWKVSFQTVLAPVLTTLLYLLIFSYVLSKRIEVYPGVSYTAFLIPGLVMMSMLQNSFANSSSSLIQSKVTGNIVFVLLPPLSAMDFFGAYLAASVVRGFMVGLGVLLVAQIYALTPPVHIFWAIVFGLFGCGILGCLGIIAGVWAEKFDQLAAFQNFIIVPLSFLSGVFYSIHSLPPFWRQMSRFNPFFYMIDGFRYSMTGYHDGSIEVGLVVLLLIDALLWAATQWLLAKGWRLKT